MTSSGSAVVLGVSLYKSHDGARADRGEKSRYQEFTMSKFSYALGLALAMSLGAVATSGAQTAQRPTDAQQQQEGMRRGPGRRGEGMLLKGINLTENQKAQVKTLRESQRKEFEALRGKREQNGAVARTPRDTTGWGARRAEMGKRREQQIASLRAILTPAQRVQLDKNVAEMQGRRKKSD